MAYSCEICGKGKQFGHSVPFSQKKTNKVWKPNLQRTRLEIDGTKVRVKICTQCMRTLAKYGREAAAKDQPQETETVPAAAPAKTKKAATAKKTVKAA
ncbi:MAG TPA: 50S ribosomal protein L28 [Candidatus Saccharimonadales bacterium]|nr:50S ribosomal protein L28 [Candidatus Saccharimonadales bacterium]